MAILKIEPTKIKYKETPIESYLEKKLKEKKFKLTDAELRQTQQGNEETTFITRDSEGAETFYIRYARELEDFKLIENRITKRLLESCLKKEGVNEVLVLAMYGYDGTDVIVHQFKYANPNYLYYIIPPRSESPKENFSKEMEFKEVQEFVDDLVEKLE